MKKRTFKTAKVLENKGLRPFFYAHLSLSCRLNLQADSENSSKIFEIMRKKKELSRSTAPMEDRVKFRTGGLQPSRRLRAVPSRSRQLCCRRVRHLCSRRRLRPSGIICYNPCPGIV